MHEDDTKVINHEEDNKEPQPLIKYNDQASQERTLLPRPLAGAVSFLARSSSLSIQLGSFLGGLAIDGARVTTLTGLEISRSVIESILHQAGGDVATRSTGELGMVEAETMVERSIATLHRTVIAISFAASTGFYLSSTVLGTATDLSQQFLASLDSILGSTDSSRAISSIVTLIRREFQNPATGRERERVGVLDLLVGICGLALLQKWCEKIDVLANKETAWEEIVWDVVTLSDGERVDVSAEQSVMVAGAQEDPSLLEDSDEVLLRKRIMDSLPQDALVSITTETSFSKSLTVKIVGAHPTSFALPNAVQIIEETASLDTSSSGDQHSALPVYEAVYSLGTNSSKLSTTPLLQQSRQDTKYTIQNAENDHMDFEYTITDNSTSPLQSSSNGKGLSTNGIKQTQVISANEKLVRQPVDVSSNRTLAPSPWSSKPLHIGSSAKEKNRGQDVTKRSVFRQVLNIRPSTALSVLWPETRSARSSIRDFDHTEQSSATNSPGESISTLPSPLSSRSSSPTNSRHHSRSRSQVLRLQINRASTVGSPSLDVTTGRDYAPSIYTIRTSASTTSLALHDNNVSSAFGHMTSLQSLRTSGQVATSFPPHHLVRNITRFVRFASASYGASFLRVMGIGSSSATIPKQLDIKHHHEHHSFSKHTQLPPDTILLSSFVDPADGTDSSGQPGTGVPMVHFVSLDHDSKAAVLTCRGTLGFEDVLTDMTCDYDILRYQGKDYSVHRGIHASARRLLNGEGCKVIATIMAALEEFPEYGVVMCGHSLGGAVVALLAIMISQSSPGSEGGFVTSYDSTSGYLEDGAAASTTTNCNNAPRLPPGRPIHVYAYGPPAALSPALRQATRGLITTIVNGQDIVPYLSLGVLHDMQAVALAFKNDDSGAKGEVRARVWEGLKGNFNDRWHNQSPSNHALRGEDDKWAYSALKALRASMLSPKLVPPGEVFQVQSSALLRRDAFLQGGEVNGFGRPATRSVLKYVRNVDKKFGEIRFGTTILLDHSPGRYEASLNALAKGVLT